MKEKIIKLNINIIQVIQVVMLIVTIFSFIISLKDIVSPIYRFSFIQPLVFGMVLLLRQKELKYIYTKISGFLIFSTYFIRMSILPLLAVLGNHAYIIPSNAFDAESYTLANFLAAYEFLILSYFLFKKAKNSSGIIFENYTVRAVNGEIPYLTQKVPRFLVLIIVIMIAYMFSIFASDSTVIRQNFSLLVGTPEGWYVRASYRSIDDIGGSGVLGILVTLTLYVFWYLQAILPPVLLIQICKSKMKNTTRTFSILLIATLLFMVTSGTKIHSLECGFAFLILVYLCYGGKYVKLLEKIAIIGGVAAILGVMTKSGFNQYGVENFHKVMSAYFGGVQNIAASIYAVNHFEGFGIKRIFPDIINQIPLFGNRLKFLLNLDNTTGYLFNHSLTSGKSLGQIIPAIGQGYSYFGFILAPIIPLVAALLADKFDLNAMNSDDLIKKNIYIIAAIMMSRAVVTTNLMSAVSYIFNTYISLLIVYGGCRVVPRKRGSS